MIRVLLRLLVALVVIAALIAGVPALRTRAVPLLVPALVRAHGYFGPAVDGAMEPLFRWSARNEEEYILATLRRRVGLGEPLPSPREFTRYVVEDASSTREGKDPWGAPYFLLLRQDSIRVGSAGADGERGTGDDVVSAAPRR